MVTDNSGLVDGSCDAARVGGAALVKPINAEMAWTSDAVAEMLRRLKVKYIALNPGASYRGLHDSLVNYLGNRDPEIMVCLHEEHAVGIAQGYASVTEKPMAVAVHANVGLMHATMAIFSCWCSRDPILILGATGPTDAEERRPWSDWIHTSKDQASIIRHYTKWDDEPRSAGAAVKSLMRAWQIASTPPYGATYVCFDAGLQESRLVGELQFPDVDRYQPGVPGPTAEAVERAAKLLTAAKKPLILMGRVSRPLDDWQTRIDLAEELGAAVLTDLKNPAAFPTDHPLHPVDARSRPSPAAAELAKQADVILALNWKDLKGFFRQTLGKNVAIKATVINCTADDFSHNGWSMDYCGLPAADLKILSSPEALLGPLLTAVRKERGTSSKAMPKFPPRPPAGTPPEPRQDGIMRMRDMALVMRNFCSSRDVSIANLALGWSPDALSFNHPLDYFGHTTGVGIGPSRSIGVALALKDSGRLPITVVGDGDFTMGCTALWTASHMQIPILFIVANNQAYHNDVGHQEHVAKVRGRPTDNKFVGQEMVNPPIDLLALARAQGFEGEGPIMNATNFADALQRGEKIVRSGGRYFLDVQIDIGAPGDSGRDQTGGRKD